MDSSVSQLASAPPPDHERPIEDVPPLEVVRGVVKDLLAIAVPALVLTFLLNRFVVETTVVFGESMAPQLRPSQRLVVEKISYRFREPERGQMVVIEVEGESENLIKRVVAEPGETIEIVDGQVYVNEAELPEPYVEIRSQDNVTRQTLKPTEYFVLGDNRPSSRDSRVFGPVAQEAIVGRAWLRYWPLPAWQHFAD